jgi:hypothetical protein
VALGWPCEDFDAPEVPGAPLLLTDAAEEELEELEEVPEEVLEEPPPEEPPRPPPLISPPPRITWLPWPGPPYPLSSEFACVTAGVTAKRPVAMKAMSAGRRCMVMKSCSLAGLDVPLTGKLSKPAGDMCWIGEPGAVM